MAIVRWFERTEIDIGGPGLRWVLFSLSSSEAVPRSGTSGMGARLDLGKHENF
jgi:hypothetical protein